MSWLHPLLRVSQTTTWVFLALTSFLGARVLPQAHLCVGRMQSVAVIGQRSCFLVGSQLGMLEAPRGPLVPCQGELSQIATHFFKASGRIFLQSATIEYYIREHNHTCNFITFPLPYNLKM